MQLKNDYTNIRDHKPTDEYDPSFFNIAGMVQDAQLLLNIGLRLANDGLNPQWKDGSEFKAAKE